MSLAVKAFAATSGRLTTEVIDALTKARRPVRHIEVTMTDDYKRRKRAWAIDVPLSDDVLREVCEFVEDSIAQGMSDCMIVLTNDDPSHDAPSNKVSDGSILGLTQKRDSK
jgi:hypothetical protein